MSGLAVTPGAVVCFRCNPPPRRGGRRAVPVRTLVHASWDDITRQDTTDGVLQKKRAVFPRGTNFKQYSLEQLAFMSRKEQGIMPDGHDCTGCCGVGGAQGCQLETLLSREKFRTFSEVTSRV
jgi:hypothetical protein